MLLTVKQQACCYQAVPRWTGTMDHGGGIYQFYSRENAKIQKGPKNHFANFQPRILIISLKKYSSTSFMLNKVSKFQVKFTIPF